MLLKDDKLQAYAGLLNDEAPENHFLAYITPGERDMLVQAGGVKTPTESGIFAYPPGEKYGGTNSSGGFNDPTPSSPGSNSNSNNTPSPGDTGGEGGSNPQDGYDTQFNNSFNDNDDIDSTYTDTSFDVTPEPVEKNFFEKVIDFVKGGGITGAVLKSIGGKLNPKNKYEGIDAEDDFVIGIEKGNYNSTPEDYAKSRGLGDYTQLDLEEQQIIDQKMYDDGFRSQSFNDLYNDGDTSNLDNLTTTERNEINKVIPNLPDAIGGTTPQESMVNKYFANLNNTNLGISQDYLNTYNAAKTKMANTLNMTPPNQQFGYGNTYNDTYARKMNNTNVFYNYLNEQGLI